MRVLVLGTADDALGFGLAGAIARVPKTVRELESALAHVEDERPSIGLVLVSGPVAALSPRAVRAFAERAGAPPVLVLPEGSAAKGASHEGAR